MRKMGFVFAAIGALVIALAPVSSAFAQAKKEPKKLSQGWVEELKKAAKVK